MRAASSSESSGWCASRASKTQAAGLRRRVGGAICAAAAAWRCVVSLQGWLRDRCGQLWSAPAKVAVCAASEQVCRPLNEVSLCLPGTLQWHLVVASMSIIPSVTTLEKSRSETYLARLPRPTGVVAPKKPRSSQSNKASQSNSRAPPAASLSPAEGQRHRPYASWTHSFRTPGQPSKQWCSPPMTA